MLNLMQLLVQVHGQTKTIPINRCVDRQCSGICDQLMHFMIEVNNLPTKLLYYSKGILIIVIPAASQQ